MRKISLRSLIATGSFIAIISIIFISNLSVIGNTNTAGGADFVNFDLSADLATSCGSGGTFCHKEGDVTGPGTGSISIEAPDQITPGTPFNANITVNGFSEAVSDTIVVGFRSGDGNNTAFSVTTSPSFHQNHDLDISGNSQNKAIISGMISPGVIGNYTITALALYADTSDAKKLLYIYKDFDIEVVGASDTTSPEIQSVLIKGVQATNSTPALEKKVLIEVNATDDTFVKNVLLTANNNTPISLELNVSTGYYEYVLDTFFFANGPLNLKISVNDSSDNTVYEYYTLTIENDAVEGDVTAYKIFKSEIVIGDGVVDDYWSNIPDEYKFEVSEFSGVTQTGYVKALHDGYYLYILVAYANDDKINWIAFELDAVSNDDMVADHDGWVFGIGAEQEYDGDVYYLGKTSHPAIDNRNDVSYEIIKEPGADFIFIEFKRALVTNDPEGHDLDLEEGKIYNLKFASSKPDSHHGSTRYVHTLAISQAIPPGGSTETTTTSSTSSISPEQFKENNIINFIILGGLGVTLNLFLIAVIFIFLRRK